MSTIKIKYGVVITLLIVYPSIAIDSVKTKTDTVTYLNFFFPQELQCHLKPLTIEELQRER